MDLNRYLVEVLTLENDLHAPPRNVCYLYVHVCCHSWQVGRAAVKEVLGKGRFCEEGIGPMLHVRVCTVLEWAGIGIVCGQSCVLTRWHRV